MDTWEPELQDEARDVIREFAHLFAVGDTDLGKTSVVKHTIQVTEPFPL